MLEVKRLTSLNPVIWDLDIWSNRSYLGKKRRGGWDLFPTFEQLAVLTFRRFLPLAPSDGAAAGIKCILFHSLQISRYGAALLDLLCQKIIDFYLFPSYAPFIPENPNAMLIHFAENFTNILNPPNQTLHFHWFPKN